MALQLLPTAIDQTAVLATAQAAHDIATQAAADARAADDRAGRAMAKANTATTDASTAISQYSTLEQVAASYAAALPASVADRQALHDQVNALTQSLANVQMTPGPAGAQGLRGPSGVDGVQGAAGVKGASGATGATGSAGVAGPTGPSGTANLAIGARPVSLLALGSNTTVTVPLSHTMPDTTYRVEMAHSAVVTLASGMLTETARTTSSVTIKVTAVGLALAAGTLVVVAV